MKYIIIAIIIYFFFTFIKCDESLKPRIDKIKGDLGENKINMILSNLGNLYEVKYDVRVGRAQIDHIVIKDKIIFVIETKRWSGRIIGNKNDDEWQQILGGNSYWCRNPIKQNEYHIQQLKKIYPDYKMVNVVVFVDNNSVPRLKNIVKEDELYNFIVEYV